MAIVILQGKLTKKTVTKARQEYSNYIKITADILLGIVLIGGEYHADAEKILLDKFGSKGKDIWGGGYNITSKKIEVNALVNLRPGLNDSMDILNPKIRSHFIKLVEEKINGIQSLV